MQRVRNQLEDVFGERLSGGTGITVAVLDSGIAPHPDLNHKTLAFCDFVKGQEIAYDDNGHGTHVCGMIAGNGFLSGGVFRGIAPGSKLIVGKVLNEKGDGDIETMIKGIEWVLESQRQFQVRVLNISIGIGLLMDTGKENLLKSKMKEAWDRGMLVVCAAGNKGPANNSVSSIAKDEYVLTVGCHDGRFRPGDPKRCALYSGRGDRNKSVRKPDLVAPGTDIVSCNAFYQPSKGMWNAYCIKSGTSMATPIVSAAAALMLQKYPGMTNAECKQKLMYTATNLRLAWNQQGWGMVNLRRILE
jgi:serine protease AprX